MHAPAPEPSYRQLCHWIARGYLRPGRRGRAFVWSPDEAAIRTLMGRLVAAGLTPAAAAAIARQHVTGAAARHELGPGITLTIQEAS